MGTKEDLISEAQKEGFEFSNQALKMLEQQAEPIKVGKKLIGFAKNRKYKIAGGDVLKFGIKGYLPTSLINSDDTKELEAKVDELLDKVNQIYISLGLGE